VDGAARALALSPLMRVSPAGGRDSVARRIVVENAGLFRADPGRLVPTLPPAVDRLSAVVAPTLVISGATDPSETAAIADRIARDVRGARRLTLPSCGHVASMDCPESLNAALARFLGAPL
jgi:pimeloyl-ACP methyl ester carboxylesterase